MTALSLLVNTFAFTIFVPNCLAEDTNSSSPLIPTLSPTSAIANTRRMVGFFTGTSATHEREIEAQFDSNLNRENFENWMKKMTSHPHHIGSAYNRELSDWLVGLFKSWGYETSVSEYKLLFPTPKTRVLEMVEPTNLVVQVNEEPLGNDPALSGQLPPYNAYCMDGDVTGEVVYVNYGAPDDYELLAQRGVDVKGKIVIARYGSVWRGTKPKCAAQHGAIGCLIYSDPKDDGFFQGDVFPNNGWRNESGVQRGSVLDVTHAPGAPPSTNADTVVKIPCLPISWSAAQPLLRALSGSVAPEDWRGALSFTYHLGPGPVKVHLKVECDWTTVTARNIIAKMPGLDLPDEWVIRGNHYDAWVQGAEDPISGAVCLMEQARTLSELAKTGWKPRRTILFALWDGEEPGLLGSTAWVEDHADDLKKHAVIYVNTDDSRRGFLRTKGCPSLASVVNETARDVTDPVKKVSVNERLRAQKILKATAAQRQEIMGRPDVPLEIIGTGSDYTAFVHNCGIACVTMEFIGEAGDGSYHSIQDSYANYSKFSDPNFDYGVALAETTGRVLLRFADADVLPLEFSGLNEAVEKYAVETTKFLDDMRENTRLTNEMILNKTLEIAADTRWPFVVPKPKAEVPFLNWSPLQNSLAKLKKSAGNFEAARRAFEVSQRSPSFSDQQALDEIFQKIEQSLIRSEGLPHRPWYKHLIYAPGSYTGYSAESLPGVREAIEQRDWPEATKQIEWVAQALDKYAEEVDVATKLLNRGLADAHQ